MRDETVLESRECQLCPPGYKRLGAPGDTEDSVVEVVEAERSGGEERVKAILDKLVLNGSLLTVSSR